MPDSNHRSPEETLADLAQIPGSGGVVWSASPGGCHVNLVVLDGGTTISTHRNDAVDFEVVVLDGTGAATVDDETLPLAPMTALLIPRGARRAITAGDEDFVPHLRTPNVPRPGFGLRAMPDCSNASRVRRYEATRDP